MKLLAISIRRWYSASEAPQAPYADLAVVTGETLQRDGSVLADVDVADTPETSIPASQYPISAGQAENARERPLGPYRCNVGTGEEFRTGRFGWTPVQGAPAFATPRTLERRGFKSQRASNSDTRVVPRVRWMFGLAEIRREHDLEAP